MREDTQRRAVAGKLPVHARDPERQAKARDRGPWNKSMPGQDQNVTYQDPKFPPSAFHPAFSTTQTQTFPAPSSAQPNPCQADHLLRIHSGRLNPDPWFAAAMQRKKAEKGAADPDSDPSGKSKKIKKGGGLLSKLCFILGVVLCTILSACIGGCVRMTQNEMFCNRYRSHCPGNNRYVGGVWDSMSDRVVEMQRRLFDACQRNQVENVRQILEEV
eukprot:2559889-Rhodomonas_salina.2